MADMSTAARNAAAAKGQALPGGRYPIRNRAELEDAIRAVGRAKGGDAGRNAVRRFIVKRAKALNLASLIPSTWNSDGSLNSSLPGPVPWIASPTSACPGGNRMSTPATEPVPATSAPVAPATPAAATPTVTDDQAQALLADAIKAADAANAATTPASTQLPDDPTALKAEIARLRQENGAARTNAKAQAADDARKELAQQVGKALGIISDEPVDPAKLASEARQAKVELAVYRTAATAGADPVALLDSRAFLDAVAKLDPSDSAAVTAAITAAVTANPKLGAAAAPATPKPDPSVGARGDIKPKSLIDAISAHYAT